MSKFYHKRNLRCIFTCSLFISLSISSSVVLATPSIWQGPYVGAYIGEGFGNFHTSTDTGAVTDTSYFADSSDIGAVNASGTSTKNVQSAIAGIQIGHDWAWKQLVYGVVFDYSALPLNSSSSANNYNYPDGSGQYSVSTSMSTNWLFTLRGRVGYATTTWLPSLFYVTGGPALTQIRVNNNFNDNTSMAGVGGNQNSQDQIGWTAGAGFEVAAAKHLFLSLEYLYLQMPSLKTTSSITNTQGGFGIPAQSMTSPFTTTGNFHANLIKLELSYKFDE